MNRFGSDVVAWVGILGGGAVTVAATAAFVGLRSVGPAPTKAAVTADCSSGSEVVRELSVATTKENDPSERSTTRVLFYRPCDDARADRKRVEVRVMSRPSDTHLHHVPIIATIGSTDDAKGRLDVLRELREEIADAERRLAEVRARVELRRSQAGTGAEKVEKLVKEQEELADRLRELVREMAEVEEGGAP